VAMAAVVFGRYVVISALCERVFARGTRVYAGSRSPGQAKRELAASALSSALFGVVSTLELAGWQRGYLKVYLEPLEYGWATLLWSLPLTLLLQETAYYWVHRAMHWPPLFRLMHQVHHASRTPSAFTSFSFHPLEALFQAGLVAAILAVVPMYVGLLLTYLLGMTAMSAMTHLNVELFPAGFDRHPLWRHFIGATHHGLHHQRYACNYGLYFTFWDRWMGTEGAQGPRLGVSP